jgi:hypothetical protein
LTAFDRRLTAAGRRPVLTAGFDCRTPLRPTAAVRLFAKSRLARMLRTRRGGGAAHRQALVQTQNPFCPRRQSANTKPFLLPPPKRAQFLPRKFKVAVTVPGDNSGDIFTNDLGGRQFGRGACEGWVFEGWVLMAAGSTGGGVGRGPPPPSEKQLRRSRPAIGATPSQSTQPDSPRPPPAPCRPGEQPWS